MGMPVNDKVRPLVEVEKRLDETLMRKTPLDSVK